ncbi:kinase-like protein [Metschnikowia bicuspidata var. bicuspidata NRRL YB-4993]|uniref:1-phosphatidylinositol 4-kinase n=1 Tax=Metschnikowia bicuspidata var. bicuspidata NRRL YB-4993 TaxID=869754 RepID=A0A1A0HDV8_9ASCO|nr:kinase-like protein [Metschnikowia bicuspidata var. bicuspidata NRRL YB-4993]OBA22191.1 kinase-like protein [Metschnikowia bicuspidata var. bicuspidata NRRL YB-4993]
MEKDGTSILESIRSPGFELTSCVDYLRRFPTDIGIQHILVKKLRTYKYEDVEFLIPQLLQILVSFETNSMALEEFVLDYCEIYPHFSLVVFWNLQALVFELKDSPNSYSFQIVRNIVNKLQNVLFNPLMRVTAEFYENLQPALILCGAIAASLGSPRIHEYIKPLILAQAKQRKSFVFKLANFQKSLTKNLTLKNQKSVNEIISTHSDEEDSRMNTKVSGTHTRHSESFASDKRTSTQLMTSEDSGVNTSDEEEQESIRIKKRTNLKKLRTSESILLLQDMETKFDVGNILKKSKRPSVQQHISHSMPNLNDPETSNKILGSSEPNLIISRRTDIISQSKSLTLGEKADPGRLLRINYSKNVTEFILALQNISLRLSQLPKETRLSALRAELSIINDTLLPSEIDIPQLLPITSSRNKFHKLLKLSVNEACVLNSAERVPFLMFVEFLSDELDFNPSSLPNQTILKALKRKGKKTSNHLPDEVGVQETEIVSEGLMQVEADLSDLKISSAQSSSYDLSSLGGSSNISFLNREPEKNLSQLDTQTKKRADQMRIASLMLQQLESSGQATSEQSISIKQRIVKSMIALQDQFEGIDYDTCNELKGDDPNAGERKLENDFKLAEDWKAKKSRIRKSSPYGHLHNWDLCSIIAKNGSDLPQEAFACQLIAVISNIWNRRGLLTWTKRMKILITSANTGLVETITNAISIHSIKKSLTEISIAEGQNTRRRIFTLKDYFIKLFGGPSTVSYRRAQENFAKSLASYSIICYVLQIKDRHNGNIMLDNEGHIIHIDFGFLLSNSPGSVGFEAAPFKLTMEYVDLLDGVDSALFADFRKICKDCFLALREESELIINMVEIMQKESSLPCFNSGENTSVLLKQRLQLHLDVTAATDFVDNSLIGKSLGNMYTRLYDQFQLITQGIYN